jgi:hypothetical protein
VARVEAGFELRRPAGVGMADQPTASVRAAARRGSPVYTGGGVAIGAIDEGTALPRWSKPGRCTAASVLVGGAPELTTIGLRSRWSASVRRGPVCRCLCSDELPQTNENRLPTTEGQGVEQVAEMPHDLTRPRPPYPSHLDHDPLRRPAPGRRDDREQLPAIGSAPGGWAIVALTASISPTTPARSWWSHSRSSKVIGSERMRLPVAW